MSAPATESAARPSTVVGLDLAGSPSRRTGFCLLENAWDVRTRVLHGDDEIREAVLGARPQIVSVDAPLSLPRGRRALEIPGPPHLRACDRELLRRRIPFFPVTLGPMRLLTARGIRLRAVFEAAGLRVIESYPGGAQDVLGIPRKLAGTERPRRALVRRGFRGDVRRRDLTHDELDAITSAWVGRLALEGLSEALGDESEGQILMPRDPRYTTVPVGAPAPFDPTAVRPSPSPRPGDRPSA